MKRLPVLISIPHGGTSIPIELEDRVTISAKDIFEDADTAAAQIFDLGEDAVEVVPSKIARMFVDVNRQADDRPPENPDGVIKSLRCDGAAVYKEGCDPDRPLIAALLDRYYYPYHLQIGEAIQNPELKLALDCHTMAVKGLAISNSPGQKRPMICIGNAYGKTCDPTLLGWFSNCLSDAFKIPESQISLNKPFGGGYIVRTYGHDPVPWIEIHLNRILYMKEPWYDDKEMYIEEERILELRQCLSTALRDLLGQ